jgi:thiamine-monophosphate kinase
MKTLKEIGEHAAIQRLLPFLKNHPDLKVGAGDDCAVVAGPQAGFDWVLTTDPLICGTHFLANEDPLLIGRKAVGRVLSDIAAMGAEPLFLLINIACPAKTEIAQLEAIYEGASTLGSEFGAAIIGGDMAQGPVLELHVFGVGRLPADTALLRSGARAGDAIYVTGPLGGSLRSGKHLDFIPRVKEGIALRESGAVTAMMDISDGLATDLRHICNQSHLGAELFTEKIPRNPHCSVENALGDGEDFELLFTAPVDAPPAVDFEIFRIGTLVEGEEQIIVVSPEGSRRTLNAKAFEHFSEQ